MVYTHEFWKLQKLLIMKYFSCLQSQIWNIQMRRATLCDFVISVKFKQNPLCRRGNIFVLINYYFNTIIYFTGQG